MSLDLPTVTTFWRQSGGEYNQLTERAIITIPALQRFVTSIAGQVLIDSADGAELISLNDSLKESNKQRDELLAALKGLMDLESRGRIMPIGAEWDKARAAITKAEKS